MSILNMRFLLAKMTMDQQIKVLLIAFVIFFTSCQKELNLQFENTSQTINLNFKPVVADQDLLFGKSYVNVMYEQFSVHTFKFYISEIDFINDSLHQSYKVDRSNFYLINFADSASTTITLKTNPSRYNRIAFIVGVDSLHNVNGAQSGVLDPGNGMFWTWNSGYIMAKLEGRSPSSNQQNQVFEYHIGGFAGSNSVLKKIILSAPESKEINTSQNNQSVVTISVDVDKWFGGTNNISISTNPVCMTPGILAKSIANNYFQMFTIKDIVNN